MKVRRDGILETQPVSDAGGSLTVDGTVNVGNKTTTGVAAHGRTTVGTSAVQLASNALTAGMVIKAASTNLGIVYIGSSSSVTTSNGFELAAGDTLSLDVDNTSDVWAIATLAAQAVTWIGT